MQAPVRTPAPGCPGRPTLPLQSAVPCELQTGRQPCKCVMEYWNDVHHDDDAENDAIMLTMMTIPLIMIKVMLLKMIRMKITLNKDEDDNMDDEADDD